MAHPEINERVVGGKGNEISLKNCGSLCHRTTCHPRATISGQRCIGLRLEMDLPSLCVMLGQTKIA
jgi:hypothetical protein